MGVVRCGVHRCKCCWRCDRCPRCEPETGRLRKGDYCADCVAKMKAEGLVWSDYYQNYVTPADQKTGQHAQAKLRAWEVRVQALECQGLTRSDAQAVVDAEDTKTAGEQLALIVETIREVQS